MNQKWLALAACLLAAALWGCGGSVAEGDDGAGAPIGVYEMETFLTNIKDPAGERHARVKVKLAVAPEDAVEDIRSDELLRARLRDKVLSLLTAKTYQELYEPKGKEQFRSEVKTALQSLVGEAEIKEVLFSDFVVQ